MYGGQSQIFLDVGSLLMKYYHTLLQKRFKKMPRDIRKNVFKTADSVGLNCMFLNLECYRHL